MVGWPRGASSGEKGTRQGEAWIAEAKRRSKNVAGVESGESIHLGYTSVYEVHSYKRVIHTHIVHSAERCTYRCVETKGNEERGEGASQNFPRIRVGKKEMKIWATLFRERLGGRRDEGGPFR